jgi:quinol monooxygenase YgiN
MVHASRAEHGCIEYAYSEDIFDPGLIHVKELWLNQEVLNQHFASEHIRAWRSTWATLGIGERDLRAFDVREPRPT